MKTLERMASNRADKASVVYPAEIGRAEWSLDNPPSAVGLKLLLLVVSALGDAVADDVVHDLPVTLLRQVPGLAGMGKDDLERVLFDLARVRALRSAPLSTAKLLVRNLGLIGTGRVAAGRIS